MSQSAKDILISGLSNAYALEGQALENNRRQVERLEHYPELRARIEQHIAETERQQATVERCLEGLGTSGSGLKEAGMKLGANLQAMAHSMAGDEVLKNTFTAYAFEHFEIASYRSLIATAEAAGQPEIARECQGILREEEAMAAWLNEHLEDITKQYVARSEAGTAAQR